MPLASTARRSPTRTASPASRSVASEISTCPPTVNDSMRPAWFTALPTTPYLVRRSEPMFPTTTSPVWTAIPISSRGRPSRLVAAVELGERLLHRDRARHGAPRVVGTRDGRAEDREDRVAHELVDRALVREHDVRHRAQVAVEQAQHLLRRQPLRERGEAAQVGHQQRHAPLLAADSRALGRGQQVRHHLVAQVAAEQRLDEAVAQLEVVRETRDLLLLPAQRELGLDPRQHHREVERLRDVVVGAEVQRLDHVLGGVAGRGHHHRQVRLREALAQRLEHVDAGEARHHHVEQHQVEVLLLDHRRARSRRPRPR